MRVEAHAGGRARGVCFVGMRAFRIAVPCDLLREQSGGQYGGVRAVHGTQKHGIKVTSVCAGDIKTNFTANRVKYAEGGERYGDAPKISAQKIDSREHKRMRLQPAAKKIYKCCNKCKKPMYIIGFKYKVLNFLRHILPQKLFLDITAKLF